MPLIGTAGHVDHGKSTLIRQLTGRDPDRLAEEKERGLTIDLGFAWATLPGEIEVSFVDVPGHQRFAKNMLAGIEAIDVALFVVAADEGWMPQSEEHLAVLDLLGVTRAAVAITKSDLVGADLLELARLEIEEKLSGTRLAGSPIIPVSSTRGDGMAALGIELGHLCADVVSRDMGRPRMWVDRVFSAVGAGLVVTGTLLDGQVSVGDTMTLYPSGTEARVRGIHRHETTRQSVGPGWRVALNLSGLDRGQAARGDMVGIGGQWRLTDRFAASIINARYHEALDPRGSFQLHVGSGAHTVFFSGLDDDVAVLRTEGPIPLAVGDRFILRDIGRQLVVAGGMVLDPAPGRTLRAMSLARELDPSAGPDSVASTLLQARGTATVEELRNDSGGGTPRRGERVGDTWLAPGVLEGLTSRAVEMVTSHHQRHPLRVGIRLSTLATGLGVGGDLAAHVVSQSQELERLDHEVALAGRTVEPDVASSRAMEGVIERLGAGLDVPTVDQLGIDAELAHLMVRRGDLVRISPDLVMLPDQIDQIRRLIESMPDGFTVAQFRDRTGLSRKYAVPILEWADTEKLTVRRGDTRRVR